MADEKISGVPAVVTPAGTDQYATNQGGVSKSTTLAQILAEVPVAGDVFKVGTPLINQIGVWTGDGTIRGFAGFEFSGTQFALPNYSFPVADGSADQVLSTDGLGVLSFKDQARGGGLLSTRYLFDTSIVAADPGPGNIRFNNAVPASVTEIFIDAIDEDAVDVTNILSIITTNDRLYIQTRDDASEFIVFNVTAPITDNTGWFTITGTIEASGGLPSSGEDQLVVLQIGGAASGGGDVFKVGTPVNNQLGVWTGDGTIEGGTGLTYDGTDFDVTGNILLQGASRPAILNAVCSLTVPTLIPFATDPNTGIGGSASDQLALICGGITAMYLRELSSGVLFGHKSNIGLTADVSSVQGGGPITSSYNVYSIVANPGDAATLPAVFLQVGIQVHIKNDGANSMDVFPALGDDLGQGTNVALAVPAGTSVAFLATAADSTWTQIQFEEGGAAFPLLAPDGTVGAPSYSFANNPTSGLRLVVNNLVSMGIDGTDEFRWAIGQYRGSDSAGPVMLNEAASATNPTFCPNQTDLDTGIGWSAADVLSLIAGGVELGRLSALGDALLVAGSDGSGNGGTFTLRAGASGGSSTKGGSIAIEATNGAGGGAEGGDISLTCGNANGSGDDGGDFLAMAGAGVGASGDGGNSTVEAGTANGAGDGGIASLLGGQGNNGTGNPGGVARVKGGLGSDTDGIGGNTEILGGLGVGAGDGGDAIIAGGVAPGAGADGDILLQHGGATQFLVVDSPNAEFQALDGTGPALRNRPASGTVPTVVPHRGDLDTGIGSAQVDSLALISGGRLGLRLSENNDGVIQSVDADIAITAFASGGQGNLVLTKSYNVLSVVATAGDAVTLPSGFQVSALMYIKNDGAEAADIFPSLGDDLGLGTNIAFSLPAGEAVSFIATVFGSTWTRWFGDTPHSVHNDAVQARRTTDQILTTAYVDVTMDATDVETDPAVIEHNDIATDDIDVLVAGTYEISYEMDVETTEASGSVLITADGRVRINNTGVEAPGSIAQNGAFRDTSLDAEHFNCHVSCTFVIDLAASDVVTLQIRKTEIAGGDSGQFEAVRTTLQVKRLL